jgi:hypothetical protein
MDAPRNRLLRGSEKFDPRDRSGERGGVGLGFGHARGCHILAREDYCVCVPFTGEFVDGAPSLIKSRTAQPSRIGERRMGLCIAACDCCNCKARHFPNSVR